MNVNSPRTRLRCATPVQLDHRHGGGCLLWTQRPATRAIQLAAVFVIVVATVLVVWNGAVHAAEPGLDPLAAKPKSISEVFDSLRVWVMGFLGSVATFFFLLGGARYAWAGDNAGETEKAKNALKGACIGYVLALLSPMIISAVKSAVT